MCRHSRGVATLRDRWRSPLGSRNIAWGQSTPVTGTGGQCEQPAEGYWEGAPSASG
jgi:hypothetical protein